MAEAQEAEKGRPAQSKVRTGESCQGSVVAPLETAAHTAYLAQQR